MVYLEIQLTRAFAQWNMETNRGTENLEFIESIKNEHIRNKSHLPYQHNIFTYLSRGMYCEQIRRMYHFFKKTKFYLLNMNH